MAERPHSPELTSALDFFQHKDYPAAKTAGLRAKGENVSSAVVATADLYLRDPKTNATSVGPAPPLPPTPNHSEPLSPPRASSPPRILSSPARSGLASPSIGVGAAHREFISNAFDSGVSPSRSNIEPHWRPTDPGRSRSEIVSSPSPTYEVGRERERRRAIEHELELAIQARSELEKVVEAMGQDKDWQDRQLAITRSERDQKEELVHRLEIHVGQLQDEIRLLSNSHRRAGELERQLEEERTERIRYQTATDQELEHLHRENQQLKARLTQVTQQLDQWKWETSQFIQRTSSINELTNLDIPPSQHHQHQQQQPLSSPSNLSSPPKATSLLINNNSPSAGSVLPWDQNQGPLSNRPRPETAEGSYEYTTRTYTRVSNATSPDSTALRSPVARHPRSDAQPDDVLTALEQLEKSLNAHTSATLRSDEFAYKN